MCLRTEKVQWPKGKGAICGARLPSVSRKVGGHQWHVGGQQWDSNQQPLNASTSWGSGFTTVPSPTAAVVWMYLTLKQKILISYPCRIDLPLINERFDASLVMMRRRFHWEYRDIFYKRKNQRKIEKKYLSETWRKEFLSLDVNLGDLLLYEAMNSSWYRQPEVQQEDFWDEVSSNYICKNWIETSFKNMLKC